jgi:hypothetical protein
MVALSPCIGSQTIRMPTRRTSALESSKPAPAAEDEGRFSLSRSHASRHEGLYDGHELMAVMVFRKGAEAVWERLEAQERTIAGPQRQIETLVALVAHCHAQATATLAQEIPLVAAKDLGAYHITGADGDGPLVLLPLEPFPAMVNGEREGGPYGSGDSFTG